MPVRHVLVYQVLYCWAITILMYQYSTAATVSIAVPALCSCTNIILLGQYHTAVPVFCCASIYCCASILFLCQYYMLCNTAVNILLHARERSVLGRLGLEEWGGGGIFGILRLPLTPVFVGIVVPPPAERLPQ